MDAENSAFAGGFFTCLLIVLIFGCIMVLLSPKHECKLVTNNKIEPDWELQTDGIVS